MINHEFFLKILQQSEIDLVSKGLSNTGYVMQN